MLDNQSNIIQIIKTNFVNQVKLFKYARLTFMSCILLYISSLSTLIFITPNIPAELFATIMVLIAVYIIIQCTDLIIVNDFKKGIFHQFFLTGQLLEFFVLGKIFAALMVFGAVFSLIFIFYDYVHIKSTPIKILHILHYFILVSNITLNSVSASGFLLSYEKKIAQILISFFMNIPIFILAALFHYQNDQFILLVLSGIFMINLPIAVISTSSMIRNSLGD